MYLYLELWSARDEWMNLSTAERKDYFERVSEAVADLTKSGSGPVAFALNDPDTYHRANYEYLCLWHMPDKDTTLEFERRIRELGWYDLFDQENMAGVQISAEDCFTHMLSR